MNSEKNVSPWMVILVLLVFLLFGWPFIYNAMNGSSERHIHVECSSNDSYTDSTCDSSIK